MLKRKKLIVLAAVLAAAAALVVYVRAQYVLPVLMYHSVMPEVPAGNAITVSVSTFERQMAFLGKNGYNVVRLGELADYYSGKRKFPARTIAITFDDGYEDNYIYAFPVLKKYNLPAAVFIIIAKVGEPGYLKWEQISEMNALGLVTFGSHTLTHPFLPYEKSDRVLEEEICGSRKELESRLGRKVELFCYPMGRFDSRVEQKVKDAGYKLGVATNPGWRFPSSDAFAVKRIRISENCRNLFVFWFETSGYYNFIREIRQRRKK